MLFHMTPVKYCLVDSRTLCISRDIRCRNSYHVPGFSSNVKYCLVKGQTENVSRNNFLGYTEDKHYPCHSSLNSVKWCLTVRSVCQVLANALIGYKDEMSLTSVEIIFARVELHFLIVSISIIAVAIIPERSGMKRARSGIEARQMNNAMQCMLRITLQRECY